MSVWLIFRVGLQNRRPSTYCIILYLGRDNENKVEARAKPNRHGLSWNPWGRASNSPDHICSEDPEILVFEEPGQLLWMAERPSLALGISVLGAFSSLLWYTL